MKSLTELYLWNFRRAHDINEHLPYLAGLALDKIVVELGFRTGRSTSAFLMGGAKHVTAYDIHPCAAAVAQLQRLAPGRFEFILGNSMKVEIPKCDILFIDSYHSGEQLEKELKLHAEKSCMVVLHDTTTFAEVGENKSKGLLWAVRRFLKSEATFEIRVVFQNNNGLLVMT